MGIRNDVPTDYVPDDGVMDNPYTDEELAYLFNPTQAETHHTVNGVEVKEDDSLAAMLAEIQVFIDSINDLANKMQPSIDRISECVAEIDSRLQ